MPNPFKVQLTHAADITPEQEGRFRALLMAAYPQFADFWAGTSFWGGPADARLWLSAPDGEVLAHLGFGRRTVRVGREDVRVAGVGAVATHPAHRGRGYGARLLRTLPHAAPDVDFAFLECREEVAPFYASGGFVRVPNSTWSLDPDEGMWVERAGSPVMVLPVRASIRAWPAGRVDLRGMPW
ncbi:GNAT family N-acetyltransferase [Deinococcus maricopensis]|uniref:GCN5-related N-acetyltransferase n=1 Tax=Deinococcus maricopensis (strain DSM 21211 / LMG 22137 / NRRL B-23946 / LB-34) TaxID=709986 RepID=E8U5X0_DEIML|nr:GNAT family N-acetyltransferase [Deinococcus maricopensis]ADV66459.1 GCN5-related N-acetyltransferase [Deinococcus maricopensis DSM 21211]